RLRNLWRVQCGASNQFSPEMRSILPSPFRSAAAQLSLAPKSISWRANGISPGLPAVQAIATARPRPSAIQSRFMRTILPRLLMATSLFAAGPQPAWVRHVVAEGFPNYTVIAADFTGDGKPDIIANRAGETVLFVAPDWKPVVLAKGVDGVFASAVIDLDQDGDADFIGARYSPGLIFWL